MSHETSSGVSKNELTGATTSEQNAAEPVIPHDRSADSPDLIMNLTRGDLVAVAVRIIGFLTVVGGLRQTLLGYETLRIVHWDAILGLAIFTAIYLGIGVYMVIGSGTIARWLLPRTAVVVPGPPGHSAPQLHAIALSVLGAYLLASAAPEFSFMVFQLLFGGNRSIRPDSNRQFDILAPYVFRHGAQVIIGIWLFFGSRGLSRWWWSLRSAEFRDATQDKPETTEHA